MTLGWEGVKAEEIYPRPIGDLYLGSQLVLLGRYRQAAGARLTISGKVNDKTLVHTVESLNFTAKDTTRDYIPRLWANRKVGYLLGEIQRNGQIKESIDELISLSRRFGIATPYTSFFVNEPGAPPVPTPTTPMPAGGRDLGFAAPGSDQQHRAADSVAKQATAAPARAALPEARQRPLSRIGPEAARVGQVSGGRLAAASRREPPARRPAVGLWVGGGTAAAAAAVGLLAWRRRRRLS